VNKLFIRTTFIQQYTIKQNNYCYQVLCFNTHKILTASPQRSNINIEKRKVVKTSILSTDGMSNHGCTAYRPGFFPAAPDRAADMSDFSRASDGPAPAAAPAALPAGRCSSPPMVEEEEVVFT
jgi:hypothetical protein